MSSKQSILLYFTPDTRFCYHSFTHNETQQYHPSPQSLFDTHDHPLPNANLTTKEQHALRLLHNLRPGPRLLHKLPLLGLPQHPPRKCHSTTGPRPPRTRHYAPPIQHALHQRLAAPNMDQNRNNGAPPHHQRRNKRIHCPKPRSPELRLAKPNIPPPPNNPARRPRLDSRDRVPEMEHPTLLTPRENETHVERNCPRPQDHPSIPQKTRR